jgi:hypothetical protein
MKENKNNTLETWEVSPPWSVVLGLLLLPMFPVVFLLSVVVVVAVDDESIRINKQTNVHGTLYIM